MGVFAIPNPKKSLIVDLPLEKIKNSVKNISILNPKYKFKSSNEIFNQYTFESFEFLSLGMYADINLNSISENKTEITIEIRRKIGSFNESSEITNANNHIANISNYIAQLAILSNEQIADLVVKKTIENKIEIPEKWYNKTWIIVVLCIVFFPIGLYALWKNEKISKGWKIGISMLIIIIAITQFNENKEPTTTVVETNIPKGSNLDQLKLLASRLNGGGFIKNTELVNQKATISYVADYNEYKSINPKSGVTNDDYNNYWSTGNAIEKALVGGAIKLLIKASFINQVKIIIPFEGKIFVIDVDKVEFEKFIGKNLSEIDPAAYVYNDVVRREIFNNFSKTE